MGDSDFEQPFGMPHGPDTSEMDDYLFGLFGVRKLIGQYFDANGIHITSGSIRFESPVVRGDWKQARREFAALGYTAYLRRYGQRKIVTLHKKARAGDPQRIRENKTAVILFAITVLTTTIVGFYQMLLIENSFFVNNYADFVRLLFSVKDFTLRTTLDALSFPVGLLLILGTHEMAHKIAARRNGVDSTPPFFIPAPIGLGTFGAVIKIKSPMPDDNAAVDLGISGPLAGFLVAIPILIAGVMLSPHEPIAAAKMPPDAMQFGEPLLFKFIAYVLLGIPTDHMINAHPLAFAGWVGLLVTMLNLMPIGQLDGGHIAHALLGHRLHFIFSHAFIAALIVLGIVSQYYGWLLWAFIGGWIVSRGYPESYGGLPPLKTRNIIYGVVALIIFVLCFTPAPFFVAK